MFVRACFKIITSLIYMSPYKTRLKYAGPKDNQAYQESFQ